MEQELKRLCFSSRFPLPASRFYYVEFEHGTATGDPVFRI
jgi:hypothetical protein